VDVEPINKRNKILEIVFKYKELLVDVLVVVVVAENAID